MQQFNYNKIDLKTHFISGANSCMFQHQCAIIREFFSNKVLWVQLVFDAQFAHTPIVKVKSLKM